MMMMMTMMVMNSSRITMCSVKGFSLDSCLRFLSGSIKHLVSVKVSLAIIIIMRMKVMRMRVVMMMMMTMGMMMMMMMPAVEPSD